MMGCITAPFRAAGCLVLLVVAVYGWLNRDRLVGAARQLLDRAGVDLPSRGSSGPPAAASSGRPGRRASASAEAKVDSLNGWRADSVVLSAAEVASLLGTGLDPRFRKQLDSLRVELGENEITVNARLSTAAIPRKLLGPLSGALGDWEPVQLAGPVAVTRAERGEWTIRRLRIRNFPLPGELAARMIAQATGDSTRQTVRFRVPPGVRDLHVHPTGAVLYGTPPR